MNIEIMPDSKLSLCGHVHRTHDGHVIIIVEDSVDWAVTSCEELPLLQFLQDHGPCDFSELKETFGGCEHVLKHLVDRGVISVSGIRSANPPLGPIRTVPHWLTLNVTSHCNYGCLYCYNRQSVGSVMEPSTAISAIRNLLKVTPTLNVHFHGGEPLLAWETITGAMDYAKGLNPNVTFTLQTNGSLLTHGRIRTLSEYGVSVSLSIDGFTEYHNRWRLDSHGNSTLLRTQRALAMLLSHSVKTGLTLVLTSANAGSLPAIVEHFDSLGVRLLGINHLFRSGLAVGRWDELAVSSERAYLSARETLLKIQELNFGRPRQDRLVEPNLRYLVLNTLTTLRCFMCQRSPCGAGLSNLGCSPNGDLYPCDDFAGQEQFRLGNVLDESLDLNALFANSAVIQQFREATVDKIHGCSTCCWRQICCSDCTAKRFYSTGSLYRRNQYTCEYYRLLIPDLLVGLESGTYDLELLGVIEMVERLTGGETR